MQTGTDQVHLEQVKFCVRTIPCQREKKILISSDINTSRYYLIFWREKIQNLQTNFTAPKFANFCTTETKFV